MAHLATFAFCAGAPFLGYFLWKHMDNEDSPYASTAFFAWILGVVGIVGRFAVTLLHAMSSVP